MLLFLKLRFDKVVLLNYDIPNTDIKSKVKWQSDFEASTPYSLSMNLLYQNHWISHSFLSVQFELEIMTFDCIRNCSKFINYTS